MFDIKKKFTNSEIKNLEERYHKKVERTKKRGLEFSLTLDDWFMMGEKLLGIGPCDYTNMNFSMRSVHGEKDPLYPTVERIDDKKGYVRGNVCVVLQRANELKDRLVDKKTAITIIDPLDREIVQAMMLHMSKDHMEKLKTKYIPQEEEKQMPVDTSTTFEEHMASVEEQHNAKYKEIAESHFHDAPVSQEETTASEEEVKPKLPDDVSIALAYARYCNTFHEAGMSVSVTYSQFKARYIRNTCALSGEKLTEEPKSILILDLKIGFAKDNFIIVSKKMETAMTQLMIQTGLSLPKVAAMLNKVV